MPDPVLEVDGGAQLRRTLKRAGADLDDLKATHRTVADVVVNAARPPRRSGRLAQTVRAGATKRAAIVRAGRASVPYANPIHWGWPARNIAGRPFASDAAQTSEPRWAAIYLARLNHIISTIKGT